MRKFFSYALVQFYLKTLALTFVFLVSLRLSFVLMFKGQAGSYPTSDLLKALGIGLRFDLRLACLFLLLPLLLGWIRLFHPREKNTHKYWLSYLGLLWAGIGLMYAMDFAYYSYLQSRLNATILKFAENPMISAQMVWESYPVVWSGVSLIAIVVIVILFYRALIFSEKEEALQVPLKTRVGMSSILVFFYLVGLWGHASQYPLRWSEAYFSGNTFISALALNPVLYFFDTLPNRVEEFNISKTQEYYPLIADFLKVDQPNINNLNFIRQRQDSIPPEVLKSGTRPNIIYIVMESFVAYRSNTFGSKLDATPHFDKLASQGTLFTRFYVPSEATARSIFALMTGVPDVGTKRSSSRNPLVVDQASILNSFKDYDKYYFIGGSANWGNIRGVIANNVPGINLIEEGHFKSPRTDVWGISDLDLFREAHAMLNEKQDKPFFAIIQTAGFHRPYTIPEDHGDFQLRSLTEQEIKDGGYSSVEEFNSIRFSDYALGAYLELARQSQYFKNTIFVIHGDHGLPGGHAENLTTGEIEFGLSRWHVPLLLYSPDLIEAGKKIATVGSEVDVMPTVAAAAGVPYRNIALGRNLFDSQYEQDRYAFLFVWYQNPPQIGVIGDRYYTYGIPGQVKGLYDYTSPTPSLDLSEQQPELAKKLQDLTEGLFETSRYMLYHNHKFKQ